MKNLLPVCHVFYKIKIWELLILNFFNLWFVYFLKSFIFHSCLFSIDFTYKVFAKIRSKCMFSKTNVLMMQTILKVDLIN